MIKASKLKERLEKFHLEYVLTKEVTNDAIAPVLKFNTKRNKELVAFLSAIFAYGRVDQIKKSVNRIIKPMGKNPYRWLITTTPKKIYNTHLGWKHRFNDHQDLYDLLILLKIIYKKAGSIEQYFMPTKSDTAFEFLNRLVKGFTDLNPKVNPALVRKKSFWYLLPKPENRSACKRLNLFLRWMVGDTQMDLNLWKTFDKKKLIIPLDTHIMRQSKILGLTKRNQADWTTAEDITNSLKKLDSQNPTKYDFAICHIGINKKSVLKS